ncbi:hypothetical protein TURU_078033 [Turdus rufiventris]|nr:hypothetical protein TURU_078033 [Turdus rufiventris]
MGWLEMRTYHRANTSAWDFPMDMQPVQGTQAKAGQEATQGARAAGISYGTSLHPSGVCDELSTDYQSGVG